MFILTPKPNVKSTLNLSVMSLDCARHKLKASNQLAVSCCDVTVLTAAPLCHPTINTACLHDDSCSYQITSLIPRFTVCSSNYTVYMLFVCLKSHLEENNSTEIFKEDP